MIIKFPHTISFPVTITKLLVSSNDPIERFKPLLYYTYKGTTTEILGYDEERTVEKEYVEQFDSPEDGTLARWLVAVGAVVESASVGLCEIEEKCSHDVQFAGLCAGCGEDMTMQGYNSGPARATIQVAHDTTGLVVSEDEARRLEESTKRRLLQERKLSLVVDLDQTIIHATVDPTVGMWQSDPTSVNYDMVKDVQKFQLDEDPSGIGGTWYYVKQRPGLKEFLKAMSELYELHIYTMGTRAYALKIKEIVDPDGSIFGERVLSRDESGSISHKSLARLFPVDTKMVVIIDDRGDVWKWSENLIKVRVYEFFVGIGDINATFLPKKQEFPTMDAAITAATASADAEDDGAKIPPELEGVPIEKSDEIEEELAEDALQAETLADAPVPAPSTLDALISMSGGATADPQALITDQAAQLENAIKAQKESRPLAKMQEEQDKLDEAMAAAEGEAASGSDTPSELGEHPKKHSVLHDNDVELYHLTQHLTDVHKRFYETLDSARGITNGTPQSTQPVVPAKKNPRKRSTHGEDGGKVDLRLVPDVAQIMSRTKRQTFKDCVIVFSGIIPLNANVQLSDPAIWAKSFGATVVEHIDSRVTHVVAARNRTTKVRLAARYEHIKIVTIQWLHDSLSQWQRMPEENYLMKVDPNDLLHPKSSSLNGMDDFNGMNPVLSSDDDSDDSEMDEEDDFDEDEFLEGETGAVGEGSNHLRIGEIDWADVDDEVNEFFGDMSDDSDEDDGKIDVAGSVKSSRSERIEVRKKRTHAEADGLGDKDGGGGADSEADGGKKKGRSRESSVESVPAEGGSRLAKRQKIARERAEEGSALKVVKDAPETPVEGEGSKESESESDRKKREEEEERSLEEALENELLGLDDDEDETGGAGGGEGGERDDGKA